MAPFTQPRRSRVLFIVISRREVIPYECLIFGRIYGNTVPSQSMKHRIT